jgi:Holliday junction resolvase RusA-like endonuclease
MKRGQQKTIPAFTGKREYLHVVGAYNWRTDQVTTVEVERKNTTGFITFLEEVLVKTYSTQAVILVMDNASCHYRTVHFRQIVSVTCFKPKVKRNRVSDTPLGVPTPKKSRKDAQRRVRKHTDAGLNAILVSDDQDFDTLSVRRENWRY